ncbi:uncharacterized protein LOC135077885 [Ostrinia nubilalis]|uniref:uncharacterized protein LOC135077885 n=1 Tax=Ostrinia nubilalis TaxID=29057 RepID=UPI0030825C43
MFPDYEYFFYQYKGMCPFSCLPLEVFQPDILAVPAYVEDYEVITSEYLQKDEPNEDDTSIETYPVSPVASPINEPPYHWTQAVATRLVPVAADFKFTFTKTLSTDSDGTDTDGTEADGHDEHCGPKPPAPVKPAPLPPLGSTPRRQSRRRLIIITKVRRIDFDVPEE